MQSASAEAVKEDTNIERSKVMKTIGVKLTISEVADRAKSAANYQKTFDELNGELDGHRNRLKPQIKESAAELHRLLEVVEAGKEERIVEVEMVKDYVRQIIEYVYDGNIVESHNMTADDRQQTFFNQESAVGTKSENEELVEVIDEETHKNTKVDLVTT